MSPPTSSFIISVGSGDIGAPHLSAHQFVSHQWQGQLTDTQTLMSREEERDSISAGIISRDYQC